MPLGGLGLVQEASSSHFILVHTVLYELRMNSDIGQVRVVFGVMCESLGEAQCNVGGLAWCLGMLKAWSKPLDARL